MRQTKKHLVAGLIMLLGTASVFGLLLLMNAFSSPPDKEETQKVVDFAVAPKQKPPEKKKRPPRQRDDAPPRPTAPPPPIPNLASSLSSVSLGLPGVDVGEMGEVDHSLLGDVETSVMTEDAVDKPPRPVRRTAAPYPPRARAKGVTGHVKMSLLIDERGNIERIKVLESKPAGVFEETAKQSVEQWQFETPTYNGEPVKTWVTQTVRFELT